MCEDRSVRAPSDARGSGKTLVLAPALLGLLLFHFTAVALHVCPPNPASLAAQDWVHAYLVPHFRQRWELFAPDPGGENESIYVRCHLEEGGEPVTTDWIDVTSPLIEAHQRNRFSHASRVLRAYRPRFAVPRDLERKALRHLDGEAARAARRELDEEARRQFELGKRHAQRLASAECKGRFAAEEVRIDRVEIRHLTTKVPPFGSPDDAPAEEPRALAFPPLDYVEVDL